VRFVISNVTGSVLNVHVYKEVKNEKKQDIFVSVSERGPLHGQLVDTPYPTKEWLQPKRYSAHTAGTTYIYDFPELFRQALSQLWSKAVARDPSLVVPPTLLKAKELVLDEKDRLHEVWRPAGSNTIGMVAWNVELFTPEFPKGRRIILIGNDITHVIGSFGPAEDKLFFRASEMARRLGLPRVYISANSGARIGIAEEVMAVFRVAWNNKDNPHKGASTQPPPAARAPTPVCSCPADRLQVPVPRAGGLPRPDTGRQGVRQGGARQRGRRGALRHHRCHRRRRRHRRRELAGGPGRDRDPAVGGSRLRPPNRGLG
jgi:hypothetical protein